MTAARLRRGKAGRGAQINDDGILPLINIVFLLLIFFLLAAHIAPPEPADITPPISAATPDAPARPAILHIAADGGVSHNGVPVQDLMATVTSIASSAPDAPVTIRADQGAPAASVLRAARALRMARVAESQLVVILGQ